MPTGPPLLEAGGKVDRDNPSARFSASASSIRLFARSQGAVRAHVRHLAERLPQELRLAGITGIDEANRFLKEVYLPQHNARFALPAEVEAFVPSPARSTISSIQAAGTLDNTVRSGLQLPADRHRRHYVKATVRVHEYPDGTLAVFHGPRCLARYNANGEPIDTPTRQAA